MLLTLRHTGSEETGKGEHVKTKIRDIITLKSDRKDGQAIIDAFIEKAFSYYKNRMDDRKTTDRLV